jgi:hypothetical protein
MSSKRGRLCLFLCKFLNPRNLRGGGRRKANMRMRPRNNLPIQILFPLALTALLLLLSSVFPGFTESAVAQTEKSGICRPIGSFASFPSTPSAVGEPSKVWEDAFPQNCFVSASRARHNLFHGTRTRNTYRRYIVLATAPLPAPVNLPDITCLTPLLVLEIHLVAQSSLCYHHSGRSPPSLTV